ncbi:DUF397 domain-containing protein [Streptomyces sp. L2]|uniref:DUF397 domain-containing protein n=1 Tax=Streptomyces sp. L2 TaxID=2162665 RepID=UPI001011DEAA|nr:DUF397 domain-containing protein [Streptomyces sp. L2]
MTEHTIPKARALSGWRKSSYSGTESNSRLEVLHNHPAGVPVRDSRPPQGPALLFNTTDWSAFTTAVKPGTR